MCKNSTKVRKSSNGSEYVDNYFINDVDDYFKTVAYDEKKRKPIEKRYTSDFSRVDASYLAVLPTYSREK